MPNKTLYVKDADLPLMEQAQEQLGESISSIFAEFLRERVAKLTPEENRIIELTNRIARKREMIRKDRGVPGFVEGEYAEAETHASKALKSLRKGEIRSAKALFWAANAFFERAERDEKEIRELVQKVATLLGEDDKPRKSTH